jgi:uncharacterized protein (TIGR03086 family)
MDANTMKRAVSSSRSVVTSVTSDQMDDPTPCQSWKVRDLINHMIQAPTFAAIVMETGEFESDAGEAADHAADDYIEAYDAATARAIAAFGVDGALEKVVKLPFGEMPGSIFLHIAAGDAFVHGWDLAKATGQATDLDPDLAAELLVAVSPLLPDQMRGPDGKAPFGPVVEVPADATAADRLAGFLGRRP